MDAALAGARVRNDGDQNTQMEVGETRTDLPRATECPACYYDPDPTYEVPSA
jgi:rubredoxin